MVAELQLDPLQQLTVGGVLALGDSRSESYIFESSRTPSLLRVGLFLMKITSHICCLFCQVATGLPYATAHQMILLGHVGRPRNIRNVE